MSRPFTLGQSAYRSLTSLPCRQPSSPLARARPACFYQRSLLSYHRSRRFYADQTAPAAPELPRKKKAGVFRWTWRFTKLSLAGGLAYLAYTIYLSRNPADQVDPDPSKKTLVVLGMVLAMSTLKTQS